MQEIAARLSSTDEIGDLYRANAEQLRQLVRFSIRAPDAVIDDACQIAWSRLVSHRAGVRSDAALPWLLTTASREALKLLRRSRREFPLDQLRESHQVGPEQIVEFRDRLAQIRALPRRQQRLVWLQGFGLSYAEMAGYTGDSERTIERQVLRARRSLRRL
ncbi:MAG: sigma-70 family RNA polymerase sigma factor [Solirubrobacteraceae bacterium]